jgi:hypothetical protein
MTRGKAMIDTMTLINIVMLSTLMLCVIMVMLEPL